MDVNLSNIVQKIELSQYQIFCDMDSVLTDFNKQYEHFTGLHPFEMSKLLTEQYGKNKAQTMFWEKTDPLGPKFWSKIEWMEDGKELWEYIKRYKPILLSSPSKSQTSVEGKKIWVNEHLKGTELILRQAKEKHEFAGPKNILIDDREDNCQRWREAGGIAIIHTSTKNTINELKKLGFNEIKVERQKPLNVTLNTVDIEEEEWVVGNILIKGLEGEEYFGRYELNKYLLIYIYESEDSGNINYLIKFLNNKKIPFEKEEKEIWIKFEYFNIKIIDEEINEIKTNPQPPNLIKGEKYNIKYPDGRFATNREYNGININGDHLFVKYTHKDPKDNFPIDWLYISPKNLHKYKFTKSFNEIKTQPQVNWQAVAKLIDEILKKNDSYKLNHWKDEVKDLVNRILTSVLEEKNWIGKGKVWPKWLSELSSNEINEIYKKFLELKKEYFAKFEKYLDNLDEIKTQPQLKLDWGNAKIVYGRMKGEVEDEFYIDLGGYYAWYLTGNGHIDVNTQRVLLYPKKFIKVKKIGEKTENDQHLISLLEYLYKKGQYKLITDPKQINEIKILAKINRIYPSKKINEIKVIPSFKLIKGKYYRFKDYGDDEWRNNYEYKGKSESQDHFFYDSEAVMGGGNHYILTDNDLNEYIKDQRVELQSKGPSNNSMGDLIYEIKTQPQIPQFIGESGEEEGEPEKYYEIKEEIVIEWLLKNRRNVPNQEELEFGPSKETKLYEYCWDWFQIAYQKGLIRNANDWEFIILDKLNKVNLDFYDYLKKTSVKTSLNEIKTQPSLQIGYGKFKYIGPKILVNDRGEKAQLYKMGGYKIDEPHIFEFIIINNKYLASFFGMKELRMYPIKFFKEIERHKGIYKREEDVRNLFSSKKYVIFREENNLNEIKVERKIDINWDKTKFVVLKYNNSNPKINLFYNNGLENGLVRMFDVGQYYANYFAGGGELGEYNYKVVLFNKKYFEKVSERPLDMKWMVRDIKTIFDRGDYKIIN